MPTPCHFQIDFPPEFVNSNLFKGALFIYRRLKELRFEVLWAGGAVRDLLLGRIPGDIDIATSATPEDIQKIFKKTVPVGVQFGVILVIYKGMPFEVATFRGDGKYTDGRRPDKVVFTNAENDALRRDFTINGMFIEPNQRKVFDWVDGLRDLSKKIIRTIGDPQKRFSEDKLRMLRAIRFAIKMDFSLEHKTMAAIQAMKNSINAVSKERILEEILKIFSVKNLNVKRGMDLLEESGLLYKIIPELSYIKGLVIPYSLFTNNKNINKTLRYESLLPGEIEIDLFKHTLESMKILVKNSENDLAKILIASLFQNIGWIFLNPEYAENALTNLPKAINVNELSEKIFYQIAKDLRFSRELSSFIGDIIKTQNLFLGVGKQKESTIKRWLRSPLFKNRLSHFQARQESLKIFSKSAGEPDSYIFLKKAQSKYTAEELSPKPFISGTDLIKLGLKPGPDFSRILFEVEEEQLLGRLHSKEDALDFAKSLYERGKKT